MVDANSLHSSPFLSLPYLPLIEDSIAHQIDNTKNFLSILFHLTNNRLFIILSISYIFLLLMILISLFLLIINQNKTKMLIPLNNKKRQNLCLSVLRSKEDYSVAIVELVNDANLFETVQSYRCNETDRFDDNGYIFKSNICTTDYNVITGANLYDCIEQCLVQLD